MSIKKTLTEGLACLGISLNPCQQEQLLDYLQLLTKWNAVYNLTAVRDPLKMVSRHLLDSLSILPYITGNYILDVGTGAGLPGIPLAIALPQTQFFLLDKSQKRMSFLTQVLTKLSLHHVELVNQRVEQYQPGLQFDRIVCRAYSSLGNFMHDTQLLLAPEGCWLAMKGLLPEDEIESLASGYQATCIKLDVPFETAQRHLVQVKPG